MAIIAISRQMGSGGYTIAAAVAKAMNYEYVDREIIMRAAKDYEVPEAELEQVAQRRLTLWEHFDEGKLRTLAFLHAAYYAIAERDNVVTAGRGIASLVQGVSHALRVRIIAPFEVRVQRTMHKEHLNHAHAVSRVRAYDREVAARIAYLFGPEWDIPENYDLVLNSVRDDPQLYADLVVAVARHPSFQTTPESLQHVRDLSLAARVHAAIVKHPETRHLFFEATADNGHVSLKGVVRQPGVREEIAKVASAVPGVVSVTCEQITTAFYPGPAV